MSSKVFRHRSRKCSPSEVKTAKKVCGPRKSCAYPKTYKRYELVKLARKEIGKNLYVTEEKIAKSSREKLCSRLNLLIPETTEDYRIIRGKECGPEKNVFNNTAWSLKELKVLALERGMDKKLVNKSSKPELCVALAEIERNIRIAEPYDEHKKIKLLPIVMDRDLNYEGQDDYLLTIIYNIVARHKNTCFYINRKLDLDSYFGINWDCKNDVIIAEDLIDGVKRCNKRFYICLILLKPIDSADQHVNFLLFDKTKKKISTYEPLGTWDEECPKNNLEIYLTKFFGEMLPEYVYIGEQATCPTKIGMQVIEVGLRKDTPLTHEGGFCAAWNLWMLDMKLTYPSFSIQQIHNQAKNLLKQEEYGGSVYFISYINGMLKSMEMLQNIAREQGIDYVEYIRDLVSDEVKMR